LSGWQLGVGGYPFSWLAAWSWWISVWLAGSLELMDIRLAGWQLGVDGYPFGWQFWSDFW